jgi:hypothetical protein
MGRLKKNAGKMPAHKTRILCFSNLGSSNRSKRWQKG